MRDHELQSLVERKKDSGARTPDREPQALSQEKKMERKMLSTPLGNHTRWHFRSSDLVTEPTSGQRSHFLLPALFTSPGKNLSLDHDRTEKRKKMPAKYGKNVSNKLTVHLKVKWTQNFMYDYVKTKRKFGSRDRSISDFLPVSENLSKSRAICVSCSINA